MHKFWRRKKEQSENTTELVVGNFGVVQVFPGEDKRLTVMRLEAEETVDERIITFFLKKRNG